MSEISDIIEKISNDIIELRALCEQRFNSDSYLINTFDNIQDELASLDAYQKEMDNDRVSKVLQEKS
jgi:hypothetical protein